MRKNIDIKEEDVQPLKIMAVKAGKDLKNYIQDVLSEHVLKVKIIVTNAQICTPYTSSVWCILNVTT